MTNKAPGKAHRKGISLIEITAMFPTDEAAEKWIEAQRWPDGPVCPHCGSLNVQADIKHRSMTHRCRDCPTRPMFSLKTGTVMHRTQLGYREWAIAIYLLATNLKGVSSMKLHRDLNITQKSAWCPSSKQMGLLSVLHKGGSGSSLFDVKPLGFDGSSGGFGWSVF